MTEAPRIAIDAMGGDTGPAAMIAGASRALRKDPGLQFTFYGDERQVEAQIVAIFIVVPNVSKVPQWLSLREKPRRPSATCAAAIMR